MSALGEGCQSDKLSGNSGPVNLVERNRQLCKEIHESDWFIAAINKRRRILREMLELYITSRPPEYRPAIRQMIVQRYPHLCETDHF